MERNGDAKVQFIRMAKLNMAPRLMKLIKPGSLQDADDKKRGYAGKFWHENYAATFRRSRWEVPLRNVSAFSFSNASK